jgi:branched-chain amino acid transport system substrate-binding protein
MTAKTAHAPRDTWRLWSAMLLVIALLLAACNGQGEEGLGGAQPDDGEPADGEPADTEAEAPEGEPLRLGLVTTLSGPIALFGQANADGAQLAVDELNEAGGVLGQPVELIARDDQARPEEGLGQARDLVLSEEIDALLGPISSGVALVLIELANERGIPYINHSSNSEALTVEAYVPELVSVTPSSGMEARAQGVDLAESEFADWAVVAPDYEFGRRQAADFVSTITDLNPDVSIVAEQFPELGESDFQPFITSLMGSDPEAVYSPLFGTDLVNFTRQAADLGFFDQTYFTALYDMDALQELGDEVDLDGVRAYSRCPLGIDTPEMEAFADAFFERHGRYASDPACLAYDGVHLWAQVVEEAGSADVESFVDTVAGFEFTSVRGTVEIRGVDHQAAVSSFMGELVLDEELGFYVYEQAREVPAEETWLSEEDIEAARGS